jgi:hypothetical protein
MTIAAGNSTTSSTPCHPDSGGRTTTMLDNGWMIVILIDV